MEENLVNEKVDDNKTKSQLVINTMQSGTEMNIEDSQSR